MSVGSSRYPEDKKKWHCDDAIKHNHHKTGSTVHIFIPIHRYMTATVRRASRAIHSRGDGEEASADARNTCAPTQPSELSVHAAPSPIRDAN
jgi:hypothetical protein